jgi:hypothetical protein
MNFSSSLEVIEVMDGILDFTVPHHQIRRLWRQQVIEVIEVIDGILDFTVPLTTR